MPRRGAWCTPQGQQGCRPAPDGSTGTYRVLSMWQAWAAGRRTLGVRLSTSVEHILRECIGDSLLQWHGPPFGPRYRKGGLVELAAGSSDHVIIFLLVIHRSELPRSLAEGLGGSQQLCGTTSRQCAPATP